MTFLYPLGLLGLIGIPILIIIYIIKSKYTEQTVSSTYLWTLSEQFLQKRRRRNPLAGLISLILQILAVIAISLAIAHPILSVPNAAKEYAFILDASGSMNLEHQGETRFERGKDEIRAVINGATDGSVFSLIQVGSTTTVVFERLENKDQALDMLDDLQPAYDVYDQTDALGIAQEYFNANSGVLTYFVTDTAYAENRNITLINTAKAEVNYALSNVAYAFGEDGLTVTGELAVYGTPSAEIAVEAFVDSTAPVVQTLSVSEGEKVPFAFVLSASSFDSLTVSIRNEDAMALDNTTVVYDIKSNNAYNILIVSERPFFIRTAIINLGYRNVTVLAPEDYTDQSGYGLYIFDSCSPKTAPTDGTIWLLNPDGKLDNTGFGVKDHVELDENEDGLLELTDSTSTLAESLVRDLEGNQIYISEYINCGLYRNFTTVLSYNRNPVVFAGTNAAGNREVVFAFDLIYHSNCAVTTDFLILMRNLMEYSFPDIMETVNFTVGDVAQINVPSQCESIRIDSPLGNVQYLNLDSPVTDFRLTEAGTYKVTIDSKSTLHVYASLAPEESQTKTTEQAMSLQGEATDSGFDGKYDTLTVVFIILALFFAADWMVYCYEKYQLR